jgi:NAD(P)-dependent dehydrogenase (short-subunit alcohol dehydrogenase family)
MSSQRYPSEFDDESIRQNLTRRDVLRTGVVAALGATWVRSSYSDDLDYKPAVQGRPWPPQSAFGAKSTAEEVTAGLDLNGMTALVTGCNSGIGFETMRVLAGRGVHVIGAARTQEKAEEACSSVDGRTTPLVIELTEFDTIVIAAEKVKAMVNAIDMLILNAGIMALPELQQVNGIEQQFVVNHLGHFVLARHLKDSVIAARQGRVVVVSSSAHVWAPEEGIQFDNLSGEVEYDPFKAYGQSKLANGLFSRELARRLADTRATSNSLHPGVIRTNLTRYIPGRDDEDAVPNPRMKSIPQGAATSCYVGAHPDLRGVSGYYFSDCNPAQPNAHMQDDEMAARLWAVSEELTASY